MFKSSLRGQTRIDLFEQHVTIQVLGYLDDHEGIVIIEEVTLEFIAAV